MTVTASTLSTIQQAGQAIDNARLALVGAAREQGQQLISAVAEQPVNVDADKTYANWKTTSRLAREVDEIEQQFKSIYRAVAELVEAEPAVLLALPAMTPPRSAQSASPADNSKAVDVEIKPKTPGRSTKLATRPKKLSPNDAKLLEHVQSLLNRKSWTRLTHADLASGSKLPLGSVGLALTRLLKSGHVTMGAKGFYRLA